MAKQSQFYINRDIRYLINKPICEFDIKRAGIHALKTMNVISQDTFDYWMMRDKSWSSVYIGKNLATHMIKQNDVITEIVNKFIMVNNINNNKIISRKRDALFIFNDIPTQLNIDGFQFVNKNQFTSYYHTGKFELYYNGNTDFLLVKGISDQYVLNHPLIYKVKQCIRWFELLDSGFVSYEEVYRKIHSLRNEYVNLQMPIGHYREIGFENPYTFNDKQTNNVVYFNSIPTIDPERYELIISFNFTQFILPFINILPSLRTKGVSRGYKRQ